MREGGHRVPDPYRVMEAASFLEDLERVKGIEPSYAAWEAAVLPLNYTRAPCGLGRRGNGLYRIVVA